MTLPRIHEPAREPAPDLARVADSFVDDAQDRVHKRALLRHLTGRRRVLDVGCGSGRMLDVLRDAGFEATGLERSTAAANACTARGHRVLAGDALVLLRRLHEERERYDAVLLLHVIEHVEPAVCSEWFAAAHKVLQPGGVLVVVTPNVKSLVVLEETFWLDPTHVRPYPRPLLGKIGEQCGFAVTQSYDDPATVPCRPFLRRLLARLRSLLSGANRSAPMDAVVVFARRETR